MIFSASESVAGRVTKGWEAALTMSYLL